MKFPFVSRALYERVCEDLRESELERKTLLDHVLGLDQVIADALPEEAENIVDTSGRLSASAMKAVFRKSTQQPRRTS